MIEKLSINKKSYYLQNILCSIDINNIENYLKRTERQKYSIILINSKELYSIAHLMHAIYISINKFEENINISKKLFTETLLTLSKTDQIKSINKKYYLKKGNNQCVLTIVSNKEILEKEVRQLKKELEIKEIKKVEFKKGIKNLEKEIEEMTTSYLKN